jgi:uncharacterized membrane protein
MPNPPKTGLSDNSIGAMAYFSPVPAIFFLAVRRYNKRPYVRFHAWQSVIFSAFVTLFSYFLAFFMPLAALASHHILVALQWIVGLIWVVIFLAWLWCVVGALNGKNCKLPIIGAWVDEQAYR